MPATLTSLRADAIRLTHDDVAYEPIVDDASLGALYGKIKDTQASSGSATGWSAGAFWQAYSNLTLYSLVDEIDNSSTASFGLAGSAGLTKNFSGTNLTGRQITGVQVGGLLRF